MNNLYVKKNIKEMKDNKKGPVIIFKDCALNHHIQSTLKRNLDSILSAEFLKENKIKGFSCFKKRCRYIDIKSFFLFFKESNMHH